MKSITHEIQKLLIAKETIDRFNIIRETSAIKVLPISKAYYNELAEANKLMDNVLYFIFDDDIGQYIEGYLNFG